MTIDDLGAFCLLAGSLAVWIALHCVFWRYLIFHDSWRYNFPVLLAVSRSMACSGMPDWLGGVDSGTPVALYASQFGLTNPIRLALLFLMSCLKPGLTGAIYFQKFHILALYLSFAAGMYVMGRVLYRHRLSALYLFAATLFAGLTMETTHSDQTVLILFWLPWIVSCFVLFHRERAEHHAHWYLNAAVLLAALQSLYPSPHLTAFSAALALALYGALKPAAFFDGLRRHWRCLWPAGVVLALTGADLGFLLRQFQDHVPSLRPEMSITLSEIGVTAFAQPTSLIHAFFPFGLLVPLEGLAAGLRDWSVSLGLPDFIAFDYPLDVMMFFVGTIPILLTAIFLMRPGSVALRAGWGFFALITLLVAMQQTRLYFLIFELPFFDLFRAYLHMALLAVFAVLTISGYGMEALLDLEPVERRRLAFHPFFFTAVLAADVAVALGWLFALPGSKAAIPGSLAVDACILVSGFAAVAWAVYGDASALRRMSAVIVVLVLVQGLYQAQIYRILGTPVPEAIQRFGLDEADRTAISAPAMHDPGALTRKLCTRFAECYLSRRDTASLKLDREGTFLRSRHEAVFQSGLAPEVVAALSAVDHPIFWTSRRAEPYANAAELTRMLDDHAADIARHLREVVYVRPQDLAHIGAAVAQGPEPVLAQVERGLDWWRLSYRAEGPFYLNAAIAYNAHWQASLGGRPATVVRGNFGGLALAVPAGAGTVELRYVDPASGLFFASRILMALAGFLAAVWLTWSTLAAPQRTSRRDC